MSAYLWESYFENDLEKFRQILANATFGPASSSKGGHGGKGRTVGAVANLGGIVATSPIVTSKQKICSGSGPPCHPAGATSSRTTAIVTLTRADLNWKDANGITLLHSIASSNDAEIASSFGLALLEAPALDLYVQDAESGWTALHRALYTGNINLARALINRDIQDTITPTSLNAGHIISNLIKVKDREGNSPFDVYGLSVANRMIRRASTTPLLSGSFEDEEDETADGVAGDSDDAPDGQELSPRVDIDGDELFMFGSNKNFTLGFGDEDDRKNPERIVLRRPDHLLQRFHSDRPLRQGALHVSEVPTRLPALIKHRPIKIQDVQLSKYHSAILTTDPEANLHVCGFGPGGRLGTGDETTRFQFVCVYDGGLLGKRIVHVALGQNHTIALSSQGEVFTWGSNSFGQLGYSFPSSQLPEEEPVQLLPRQVFGPMKRETVIGAAASRTHSVLHTLNSLYTFGKNDGQLGLVDSDARSLVQQNTPRKVAASLFTSSINAVSAIERATVCLLENHEVWVFANYGYTKVSFPSENFSATVVHQTYFGSRRYKAENQICKVTSGGDTICALSTMGDVFTVHVSQKMQSDVAATSSTTNPPKIRGALSAAQKVWSLRKDHMAVRDVAVGQDGSVVICTEAGSVWRRVRRAKVKNANAPGSIEYKPKDYKFSRVGGLTRINAVRSNAFGAYAAIRKDCDVLKTQIEMSSKQLWKDLYPLLPFRNLVFEDENSDTEMPAPRFWVPNVSASDTATIRRAVLTAPDLEERLMSVLKDEQASSRLSYDVSMKSASSDVIFPVHEFILGARSDVLRRGVATTRQHYYFAIPEVMTIEFDSQGKILISFLGADYITVLNLVLYMYTDVVVDVWRHGKGSPQLALGYRQIRLELMKLGSYLHMPGLEQAARIMMEPPKILDQDLERAIRNPDYFSTGDLEIELDGASVKVHSSLVCRRCPFFEALFHGRASGMWLASRREQVQASHEAMKVDLKHVSPLTFQLVLQYLYADVDEGLFDNVVTTDFDSFLDVIIDVMSLANELMLDRLQQCCQLLLGRFVNTRNVCQLLTVVAPCSLTNFKDAALEYICLNLEGMMENHLLDELDEDLMLELDQVVRQNQLACLPYSKSRKAEEELFATYPELSLMIEHEKRAKVDLIARRSRPHDDDTNRDGSWTPGEVIGSKSGPVPPPSKSRQRLMEEEKTRMKSPSLKAQTSTGDLMFEMDESLGVKDEVDDAQPALSGRLELPSGIERHERPLNVPGWEVWSTPRQVTSLEGKFPPVIPESPSRPTEQYTSLNSEGESSKRHPSSSTEKTPWNYPKSSKFDMKAIMAQASSNGLSDLSSALSSQSPKPNTSRGSPARLSQRERKRRQQQQLSGIQQPSSPKSSPLVAPATHETTPTSPWQIASPGTKVSLKEVLATDSNSVSPSSRRASARTTSNPPLTLRQTVSGNFPLTKKASDADERSQGSLANRSSASSSSINSSGPQHPSTSHKPRSVSANLPLPTSSSTRIQSVRHQPVVVEPSLQLSMVDILALQQTEKDLIREAAAKRSLQEIQEEQAFQEWWDQESRKVMEEESKAARRADVGREGRGRGKGRDRGRDGKGGARGGRGGAREGRGGLGNGRGASNGARGNSGRGGRATDMNSAR